LKNIAIVLAGGVGERAGFSRPKQLAKLGGRPLIAHTLERLQVHAGITEIAVVTNAECLEPIETLVNQDGFDKVKKILLGGELRHDSSLAAIRAYADEAQSNDIRLLFHDAVRPLISQKIITDVIAALDYYGAVDTAIPTSDTVIHIDPTTDTIEHIPDRSRLRLGQTPQGFHYDVIRVAYERALTDTGFTTTDDCGVVLRYAPEHRIYVVKGDLTNLKLTYPDDLLIIDKFMQTSAGRRLKPSEESASLSKLHHRVIVVMGGSSGIGAAISNLATAYGATVERASRATGQDISDSDNVSEFLEAVTLKHGRIDAVINTAGVLVRMPLSTMSPEEVRESVATNILGPMILARASHKYLKETRGHFLLFASSSYTYGRAFYSTYSASKAAVVNLTQALADEWGGDGIRVNCLNPERARTPMRTKAFGAEPNGSLLEPEVVARRALGVIIGEQTGIIYDVVLDQAARPN
jgi:2-C-methyl-D-erythritol 4-phosphate cytidylyltransferase